MASFSSPVPKLNFKQALPGSERPLDPACEGGPIFQRGRDRSGKWDTENKRANKTKNAVKRHQKVLPIVSAMKFLLFSCKRTGGNGRNFSANYLIKYYVPSSGLYVPLSGKGGGGGERWRR